MNIEEMSVLDRRRIEAQVLGPMVRAFQAEIGEARANEVVRRVIVGIAQEQGRALAQRVGRDDLKGLAQGLEAWTRNGALELEVLEGSEARYSFNVTRCRYAEMYRELGMADLGFVLSCNRDFSLSQGFNPAMRLTRTQTIMQGAPFCDFRFTHDPPEVTSGGTRGRKDS